VISLATSRSELVRQLLAAERGLAAWRERRAAPRPLRELLSHAASTVPFYREFFGAAARQPPFLSSFPPLKKSDVVARYVEHFSTAADRAELNFTSTSGTTGTPLRVGLDLADWYAIGYDSYRLVADSLPSFAAALEEGATGVVMLNDNPVRTPWSALNPSLGYSLIHKLVLGRSESTDADLVARLQGERVPLLYGRPRTLLRLSELDADLSSSRGRIAPSAVLSSGDRLHDDDRRRLEEWYGCPVFNAYATVEGGFVGMECPYRSGIHVCGERAVLEVLDGRGGVAGDGEGELLVTNLTSWAMPFIRYRPGDHMTLEHTSCPCGHAGPTIVQLDGRESTFFVISGRRVPPTYLNGVFEELPVAQFRFVQDGPSSLRIHWIPRRDCADRMGVERSILAALRERLGPVEVELLAVESLGPPGQKVPRFSIET
jgi:phenylacetate-coenzyme A ligase PaaK-like adenylate-forming protein